MKVSVSQISVDQHGLEIMLQGPPASICFSPSALFSPSQIKLRILFRHLLKQKFKQESFHPTHRCKIFSKSPRLCDVHNSVSINRYKSEYEVDRKHDRFKQFENV